MGPALPNLKLRFVDSDGKSIPAGREGEMWILGPTVFEGYHNNPEATTNAKTADGYFKTGDVGFEDQDGNLFITDRLKELIKYKGFQVAPAELEGLLLDHPQVEDAAVVGVYKNEIASEVPLAFIVLREHAQKDGTTAKAIIEWMNTRIAKPKHLRGGIIWIDKIPKSLSGKILRRELKKFLIGPDIKTAIGASGFESRSHL